MHNGYKMEMRGVFKSFAGVQALQNVSFTLREGEIHAIVGENGAGKSTLMKVLSGAQQKDAGDIYIDGALARITSPKAAKDLGVAVIYQEFMLAPDITVAENIYIDSLSGGKVFINWKKLIKDASAQMEAIGFGNINPSEQCGKLSIASQQVVEICKCLSRNTKILVLDEPTSVLTFHEIVQLFKVLKNLRKQGVSIVYISHRLDEIFELSDRITVLKDGQNVDTVETKDIDKNQLVSMMVGRELSDFFPKRNTEIGEVVLKVDNLHAGRMVRDVSFEVRAGEVVGFGGLVGSGRTETMRAIFGADKREGGVINYFGEERSFKNPRDAVKHGFGMLPEDRKQQGLLLEQSIRVNVVLASLRNFFIRYKKEASYVGQILQSIQTKYKNVEHKASSLSGGNQQKVSLAKWIAAGCKCIVFDEPTRGVDVGAKVEIYKVINSFAEMGIAIIMVSSEMQEIIGVCDRAYIMRAGRITGELAREDLTEENMIRLSMEV